MGNDDITFASMGQNETKVLLHWDGYLSYKTSNAFQKFDGKELSWSLYIFQDDFTGEK